MSVIAAVVDTAGLVNTNEATAAGATAVNFTNVAVDAA